MSRRPPAAPHQAARAVVLAVAVVGLGLGAHVSAGGGLPPLEVALLATVLVGTVARLTALRRPGAPVLAALLAAGQLTLHHVFAVFDGPCPVAVGMAAAGHAHTVAAVPATAPVAGCAHLAPVAGAAAMSVAHLVAAILIGVLLARGDALLCAVSRRVARVLAGVVVPAVRLPRPLTATAAPWMPRPAPQRGGPGRRGPPVRVLQPVA